MRSTYYFFILLICFISHEVKSQELHNIIKQHEENLNNLYNTRGAAPLWVSTGDVTQNDLINALGEYKNNVGLLIYTHSQDTLSIVLLNKKGEMHEYSFNIAKDSLIQKVRLANLLYSRHSLNRAPKKRGVIVTSVNYKKSFYEEAFRYLNKILLPPKELLQDFDHLIIVPTLNLSTIPYSALKISKNSFLIDELSYSIAPSLFELMVGKQMKINRGLGDAHLFVYNFTNALFVANPDYPTDSVWSFPDLPGTLKETQYITKSLDSSTFVELTGKQATVQNILRDICNYDLLYFATHGISENENPLDNSFLVFAKDGNDSYLTAREIQEIRNNCTLKADLVILSACQTGLGKEHEGGIIGLSRAFQIAGANHVLMSLWSIDDKETAVLMGFFFDYLKEGGYLMPHEALRSAIVKYKNERDADPGYWAAFSIFGIPF